MKVSDKLAITCVVIIMYGCLLMDVLGPNSCGGCFVVSGIFGLSIYVAYKVTAGL